MTDLRPTTEHQRRQLKAVTRHLMEMAGGVTSFEHVTRVKASILSKYCSPFEDAFIPADIMLDLTLDTRSNGFLSFMAAERGMKLVALEADGRGAALPDLGDVAQLVEGYSQFITSLHFAVADGKITIEEARPLKAKIEVLVQQLRSLGRTIDAAVNGGAS